MEIKLDPGYNQFPAVNWVDANNLGDVVELVFQTRVEGQGAGLRIALTRSQWENLKFLVERPRLAGS